MKNIFLLIFIVLIAGCQLVPTAVSTIDVSNPAQLSQAIKEAKAGDVITLKNGVWKDVAIHFKANGTKEAPITLRAATPGKVLLEGQSYLAFGGEHLTVEGLYFRNGYTPTNAVISFRINKDTLGNHCRVTNCVIDQYNQPHRDQPDHWIEFWGRHNQLDHCYIAGKSNQGPTVRVFIKGNQSIKNYHQVVNNHFGPRPRKGGPRGETIQIGDSGTSMSPCNMTVAKNLFERCNGEVEVISSKTNFNEFRNNVFYKCEGSLVTRHGNYCTIDGNYFIGDESNNVGGVRIINTGHWVTNNYFYQLRGKQFKSPIAVMNGIPKSPLNRYNQVTDVVIAYNSWINCDSPLQFGVGTNISQREVLPPSEIRSARPIRTIVANNLIYNEKGDKNPVVAHDKIDGVTFNNNIINNQGEPFEELSGLEVKNFNLMQVSEFVYTPEVTFSEHLYQGFDFETIENDLLGNPRAVNNTVGAIATPNPKDPKILDKKKYGAHWFSNEQPEVTPTTHVVENASELAGKLLEANSGDIIELMPGTYELNNPLVINKKITIRSKKKSGRAKIIYNGKDNTPAFEMHPYGGLALQSLILSGNNKQYAFASLQKNMSNHYKLSVANSEIHEFKYVLKAYKASFADSITFAGVQIKDCENGIELSEETNDRGDYNVEFLTIKDCQFDQVKANVIDYYRGGYDESTIGGNLLVQNSLFTQCGADEENSILLNTRGIVNVNISNNVFKNNPVKLVALLWGAKNNSHANNEIVNSGEIRVEENLKLKLLY